MTCGSELTATTVKITFSLTGDYFRRICKIGIFGQLCTDLPLTITEDAWTDSTITFDLLSDSSKTIAVPTLTISPSNCYTTTWTAHKTTDDGDVTVAMPTIFSMTATPEL